MPAQIPLRIRMATISAYESLRPTTMLETVKPLSKIKSKVLRLTHKVILISGIAHRAEASAYRQPENQFGCVKSQDSQSFATKYLKVLAPIKYRERWYWLSMAKYKPRCVALLAGATFCKTRHTNPSLTDIFQGRVALLFNDIQIYPIVAFGMSHLTVAI